MKLPIQQLRPRLQQSALYALAFLSVLLTIILHVPADLQPADRLRVLWLVFLLMTMLKVYMESDLLDILLGVLGCFLTIATGIYFKAPIAAFLSQPVGVFSLGKVLAGVVSLTLVAAAVYWDFFRKKAD